MRFLPAAAALMLLAGCSATPAAVSPSPTTVAPPAVSPTAAAAPPVAPGGSPTVIASGLQTPWSIVRLRSGSTLISERDPGVIVELTATGSVREVGAVADAVHEGEGGLLGLAYVRARGWLFA